MLAPTFRRPARAVCRLAAVAAVVALTACELPEPIDQPQAAVPVAAPEPAPAPASVNSGIAAGSTAAAKPIPAPAPASAPTLASAKPKPVSPPATIASSPTPLPRWIEAATSGPLPARSGMVGPSTASREPPKTTIPPAEVAKASTSDAKPPPAPTPAPVVAEPAVPPAGKAPAPAIAVASAGTLRDEPVKPPISAVDPVIQIPTRAYFANPPRIPTPEQGALPGLDGKPAAAPAANVAVDTKPLPPPTSSKAAAAPEKVDASTMAATKPVVAKTETAAPAAAVVVPTPPPVPAPVSAPRPAKAAGDASAVASRDPAAELKVKGGRFAGMPLPNLPSLVPEAAPAEAPVEVARSEPPPVAASAPVDPAAAAVTENAEAALRQVSERTGLTDLQLTRIDESRRLIGSGDAALALTLMRQLNTELDAAATTYTVASGDNLWRIAQRPEVYGNAYLWPLIWHGNVAQLKEPYQLYRGMRLRVPSNPTVTEVTEAIDYARRNGGEGMPPAIEPPQAPPAAPVPVVAPGPVPPPPPPPVVDPS